MAQNNMDGIKKLNKEELEKSRKILLDYIGEQDKRKTAQAESGNPVNKPTKIVDGLLKKNLPQALVKPEEKVKEAKEPQTLPAVSVVETKIVPEKEKAVVKKEINKIEEVAKSLPKPKLEPNKEIKLKHSDEKEAEKINKIRKKIEDAKARVEKKKKRIKDKREKTDKINKNSKQAKKKNNFFQKNKLFINKISKYIFAIIIILISFFIVFYSTFSFLLLKMKVDNKVSRFISKYIPVPAVITENGYLEYYYYKDLTDQYSGQDKNRVVARKILLLDLIDKYNISSNLSADEILYIINQKIKNDKENNPDQLSLDEYLNKASNTDKIKFLTD